MTWNRKMKIRRVTLDYSREYVAEKIGVNLVTYGRWERGQNMPLAVYRNIIEEVLEDDTIFEKENDNNG